MNYALKLFNTGQVTLPKKWRSKYNTSNYLAEETTEGLLIKPIVMNNSDVSFYEDKDGFGIYSDSGINPKEIISKIKKLQNG